MTQISGPVQEYSAKNGTTTNIWGTWWGRISPPVELSIALTDSPDRVLAGGNVTYIVSVTNAGIRASGVTISDPLPAGANFISGTTSQGSGCVLSNTTVVCDLGSTG